MANTFDDPPIYDFLTKVSRDRISDIWSNWFATHIQNISSYIGPNGFHIPRLTTTQRNALINVINGTMIYNITLDKFQGFEAGIWKTFVTI